MRDAHRLVEKLTTLIAPGLRKIATALASMDDAGQGETQAKATQATIAANANHRNSRQVLQIGVKPDIAHLNT